jgi:putative AdoMet-dependent methyltransferase
MRPDETPPWQFNEFQDFGFSTREEIVDYEWRLGIDPAIERRRLLELGLSESDALLELGCGPGVLAVEAAKLCRHVTAVDVSTAMLDYARAKARREGVENIDFVQAGFLTYLHGDEPVNMVVTQRALHHLPYFWKVQALECIRRMLRPGGTFYLSDLVYTFEPKEAVTAIEDWINATASGNERGFHREFFEEHVRNEHSTYSWLLEAMLERVGFEIRDAKYDPRKAYAAYTCVNGP